MSRWRESSAHVVRLADRPADRVELREALSQAGQVLEVGQRRVAPLEPVPDERAAVDRREDHVVAADVDAALGVARLQVELARRLGDLLEHEVGIEDHLLVLDGHARLAEGVERVVVEELDAELGDDAAPALVQRGHRLLGQDVVARHLVDQHVASSVSRSRSSAASRPESPTSRTSSGRPRIAGGALGLCPQLRGRPLCEPGDSRVVAEVVVAQLRVAVEPERAHDGAVERADEEVGEEEDARLVARAVDLVAVGALEAVEAVQVGAAVGVRDHHVVAAPPRPRRRRGCAPAGCGARAAPAARRGPSRAASRSAPIWSESAPQATTVRLMSETPAGR